MKTTDREETRREVLAELEAERRRQAETLRRAAEAAVASGKEPFDLARLEEMCDTSHGGLDIPEERRRAEYEYMYYVQSPEVHTLEEFAALINKLNQWS